MRLIFLISIFIASISSSYANPSFVLGNEYFQKAEYNEALEHYTNSLDAYESTAQHFNIANTYYKLNQYGLAILHYLKAHAIAPYDRDVAANLKLARDAAEIPEPSPSILKNFANLLSLNGWTTTLVAAFWIFIAAILLPRLFQIRTLYIQPLRYTCIATALICLIALSYYHTQKDYGVVIVPDTLLHVAPSDSSPEVAILNEGSLGIVSDIHSDFYFITTKSKKQGWINNVHFAKILN